MQDTENLYKLLESFLGEGKYNRAKGEAIFSCPNCHYIRPHFHIELNQGMYHCWVCELGGRNLLKLFLKYGTKESLKKYYSIVKKTNYIPTEDVLDELFGIKKEEETEISLPAGFLPLIKKVINDPDYCGIINYLRDRGIDWNAIQAFNLGWSNDWEYKNRVIIPSYNLNGKVNYYLSRIIWDDTEEERYKNCKVSWFNRIPFELYVCWSKKNLILVEGVFDFIRHSELNVLPLLGNNVSGTLLFKLIDSGIKEVFVALDSDMNEKAIKVCELLFSNGINAYYVDIKASGYKDPGGIETNKFLEILNSNSILYDWAVLVKDQLERL